MQQAALSARDVQPGPDLDRTFRDHAPQVLAAAYRITGNEHDAQDVLQTIFLRLMRRERGAPLTDNLGPYLHRAAVNAALDTLRSRKASRSTALDDVEPILADRRDRGPDRLQDTGEIRQQIRKALAGHSPKAAEIFVLRYFEGYDNREIARMVGSSPSTVAVILHRTRHRLRDEIRDYLGDAS